MYDEEKAMTDAINAITRLNWGQLLIFNAHLSEHIHNIWQHQLARTSKPDRSRKTIAGVNDVLAGATVLDD